MVRPISPGYHRRHSSTTTAKAAPPRPAKEPQHFARQLHSQWRPDDCARCPPLCHHATPGASRVGLGLGLAPEVNFSNSLT
jgi:hypothetical protein